MIHILAYVQSHLLIDQMYVFHFYQRKQPKRLL